MVTVDTISLSPSVLMHCMLRLPGCDGVYLKGRGRPVLVTRYHSCRRSILFIFGKVWSPGGAEWGRRYSCIVAGEEGMLLGCVLLDVYFEIVEGVGVGGECSFPFVFPEFVAVVLEIIHLIYKQLSM